MLYHVSRTSGLKILRPHVSTHKKPYVYAVEHPVTGLLFGAKQDDFDFILSTDENGTPMLYECYPDAFRQIYQGKRCSVYEVENDGFQRGKTSWDAELVSENETAVVRETVVEDLYERLLEEERSGTLKIYRYAFCEEYRKKIAAHIVDRLIRFEVDLKKCLEKEGRFSTYYRELIEALIRVTDGHLLQ